MGTDDVQDTIGVGGDGRVHGAHGAWRRLDRLQDAPLNFEVPESARFRAQDGWVLDEYRQSLPGEPPGPPVAGGSWEAACRLMADYRFADPKRITALYRPGSPLQQGRTMLLCARFLGLRFWFGVRVSSVHDRTIEVDGRDVRVWGWNYHTLRGHVETGQMEFEAWKWLDTGEVEFRIHAASKPARISNPFVRIGFRVFGRRLQLEFAHTACRRMAALVPAELVRAELVHPTSSTGVGELAADPAGRASVPDAATAPTPPARLAGAADPATAPTPPGRLTQAMPPA